MNINRRQLLGATAVAMGGGLSLVLSDERLVAQRGGRSPVSDEFQRQIYAAVERMREGHASEGAIAAASVLRLWATHLHTAGIEPRLLAAAKRINRAQSRTLEGDHEEMARAGKAAGADLFNIPLHRIGDPVEKERAHVELLNGRSISVHLRAVATELEEAGERLRGLSARVVRAQLNGTPSCPVCSSADAANSYADYVCGLVALLAYLGPVGAAAALDVCLSAQAAYVTLASACYLCLFFGR